MVSDQHCSGIYTGVVYYNNMSACTASMKIPPLRRYRYWIMSEADSFGVSRSLSLYRRVHNAGYYRHKRWERAERLGAVHGHSNLWWDFSDPCDLGADASGHGYDGTPHGNAAALATDTPSAGFSQGGMAASGFTSQDSLVILDDPNALLYRPHYKQQTYQMWIRNPDLDLPEDQKAVFMSLQGNTNAISGYPGDWDIKRFWINEDGSVSAGDRGYYTGMVKYTSDALSWDTNAWYQVSVVLSYTASDRHDIRVYRGKEGDSAVSNCCWTTKAAAVPSAGGTWLSAAIR